MSKIRASQATIASNCTKFVKFCLDGEEGFKGLTSKYAKEGTELHKRIEECVVNLYSQDEEAMQYASKTLEIKDRLQADGYKVDMKNEVYLSTETFHGTSDCLIIATRTIDNKEELRVVAIDYKTGHQPVKPDCEQLKVYAFLGTDNFLSTLEVNSYKDENIKAELVIIQPDFNGVVQNKTHIEAYSTLLSFIETIRVPKQADQVGDHCKYCPFKFECSIMREVLDKSIEIGKKPIEELSDHDLAFYVKYNSAIDNYRKIEDDLVVMSADKNESIINGYALGSSKRRKLTEAGEKACVEHKLTTMVGKSMSELAKQKETKNIVNQQLMYKDVEKTIWILK